MSAPRNAGAYASNDPTCREILPDSFPMHLNGIMRRLKESLADAPGILPLRIRRYERAFAHNVHSNLFRGVYATYGEAAESAPRGRPVGYDNEGSAKLYGDLATRIASHDYPAMLWLQRLFDDGSKNLFDFGGHVGITYYAYRKYLRYPAGLRWRVYDLPAVVAEGVERAMQRDRERQLSFSERFGDASGADILFASGSLQYIPSRIGDMLVGLSDRPRNIVVNQLPVHPEKSYFTLNSIGTA